MARMTVRTGDGLALKWDFGAGGEVASVQCVGRKLPLAGSGGFSVQESLQPTGAINDHGTVAGKLTASSGSLRFEGGIERAGLELSADITGGRFIEVAGEVRDTSGADRALKVSFTLPVKLAGWRWENTAGRCETVKAGRVYPSQAKDLLYLGRKNDGFADEDHKVYDVPINKLPFNAVVKGDVGLAAAYPVHEPRVFLLTVSDPGLTVTFSLGVTAITKKFPSRASFRFIIFPIDGRWGIRSAAERYQGFFPELFQTRCKRHGNNTSVYDPARHPNYPHMEDQGLAFLDNDFQLTNGEISEEALAVARSIGIGPEDIAHWRGPWYWFHEAPGDITRDAQLALLKAQAEGRKPGAHGQNNQLCGCPNEISAKAAHNSYVEDGQGKIERTYFAYPRYGCWLMPMNMDPNLPQPNRSTLATDWQYRFIKRWKEKGFRGPFSVAYDAFDDFGGFRKLNFRREHLAVMDIPATFDPASGRICQVNGFTSCLWARMHSKLVHDAGGKVLSNVNLEHSMMFGGQYIDFIERERKPKYYNEERLCVHRMLVGHKPIAFCGFSWLPKTRKGWLAAANKLLAFGMPPGPHADRWLELRTHMPVVRKVAEAGWRPVPYAKAAGLWIERFGDKPGKMFLTVRNTSRNKVRSRLQIDCGSLGLAGGAGKRTFGVEAFWPKGAVKSAIKGGLLTAPVTVPPKTTIVLAVVAQGSK